MKKILIVSSLLFVSMAQVQNARAQAPASVTGAWDYTVDTGQDEREGTLTLADSSGVLGGMMVGTDGQTIPLSDISLAEDTLSFDFTTDGYGSGTGQIVFFSDSLKGHLDLPGYGRFPISGTRQPVESTAAEAPASDDQPAFSTRTPLRALFRNEQAKAVVEQHVPGLTTNPQIDQAMDMSLREIAPHAPETFTDEVLQAIDEDLAKL